MDMLSDTFGVTNFTLEVTMEVIVFQNVSLLNMDKSLFLHHQISYLRAASGMLRSMII